jgi:hypothetical protein
MAKRAKSFIEDRWREIKAKSKVDNPNIEELDTLTSTLIAQLAQLTELGVTEVDGVRVDTYKDRTWWTIEKLGLLPEYKDDEDFLSEFIEENEDSYYKVEDEDDFEIDDSKFYR